MTTKQEMIKIIKTENPTLKMGDDKNGYTELTGADYDAVISEWADARLLKEAKQAETETKAQAKATLLNKLGITAEEAQLLLS
jgi:hypothetical protein